MVIVSVSSLQTIRREINKPKDTLRDGGGGAKEEGRKRTIKERNEEESYKMEKKIKRKMEKG